MIVLVPDRWNEFQHYRKRHPPWIKLHRSLLDNYEFHCLPDASKALAPLLWLLASDYENGEIPRDLAMISFRFHTTIETLEAALNPLIDEGFFQCEHRASKTLASRKHDAPPEAEAERDAYQGINDTPRPLQLDTDRNGKKGQQC